MPSKTKPQKVTDWNAAFVRCELDASTKEQVKKWDPKFEATMDAVDRLLSDGYKISVSPDKYHDCVGAFMTMPEVAHKHHGQCLTARGPNYLQAMKVLVFKHFQVLQEEWGSPVDQKASRDEWG